MTPESGRHTITRRLQAGRDGDPRALEDVVSLLYEDLRRIARRQLHRGRPGDTLDTTSVVHECYLKLAERDHLQFANRSHFLATVALAMRQLIVDHARRRLAEKRGGGMARVTLDDHQATAQDDSETLVAIDEALDRLADYDERLSRLVECRFFAGLTEDETAVALDVSRSTVQRDWVRARAWLREELGPPKRKRGDG